MDREFKNHRRNTRTTYERDLKDLLAHSKRGDARVADAIVTVLCRADTQTLAALGVVFKFVAMRATRGPR